jgi:signal transduction histidine kinase
MMMDKIRNSERMPLTEQGTLIAGKDGHILAADEPACRLLNYRSEDLQGQSLWALIGFHPQLSGNTLLSPVPHEMLARQSSGDTLTFLISLSTVVLKQQQLFVCCIRRHEEKSDDRVVFLTQVVNTLQQAKNEMQLSLDKEKAVNQLKTRFISLASHEFRTPLSSIQLSTDLIERYYDKIDRDQVFRHLHKIRLAVGDLTKILEDFLCLEKVNSGGIEPTYEEIDLPAFCRELTTEMLLQVKPGQDIVYGHENSRFSLLLDKKLLRHCLINLVTNAIKYSPENSTIDLVTRFTGSHCEISVTDQGIGVPSADQANLFEPFFRAHNVLPIQGTGLGLNIVKRYAELMQGSITFQSQEQEGTTFTLAFPVR